MNQIAWADEMLKLAKSEVHADWILERYKDQMRMVVLKGGNQYDLNCREIFRRFAVIVVLYQYDAGFLTNFEWDPDLEAEDYLDFKAAIASRKTKATNT